MTDPSDWRHESDERLMESARDGREGAFTALYERHQDRVINFAFRLLGNYEDAAEVFQEAFLYLHRKRAEYRPTARFTTYLYRVVRNLALNRAERNRYRRHQDIAALELDAPEAPPDVAASWSEQQRRAVEMLARVGAPHREVIVLRIMEDRSYEEIAEILEIPVGTVKSRLHHGLEKLRARFDEGGEPEARAAAP